MVIRMGVVSILLSLSLWVKEETLAVNHTINDQSKVSSDNVDQGWPCFRITEENEEKQFSEKVLKTNKKVICWKINS